MSLARKQHYIINVVNVVFVYIGNAIKKLRKGIDYRRDININ